jgi:hypothetical protein
MAEFFNDIDQRIQPRTYTASPMKDPYAHPVHGSLALSEDRQDESAPEKALEEFKPLPPEALFLGVARDGLPVLLDLFDPSPGPILVVGDPGVGKTNFLQNVAFAANVLHPPRNVQYGVITANPEEWRGFAGYPACIGVFKFSRHEAADFLSSLYAWSLTNRPGRQAVLVMLDGLEMVENVEPHQRHLLRLIFQHGPANLVWPVVTVNAALLPSVKDWLDAFQTHIFGRTTQGHACMGYRDEVQRLTSLRPGIDCLLREGSRWLEFRVLNAGWR